MQCTAEVVRGLDFHTCVPTLPHRLSPVHVQVLLRAWLAGLKSSLKTWNWGQVTYGKTRDQVPLHLFQRFPMAFLNILEDLNS